MKRIIYCSQSTHDLSPDELEALLEVSRRNNTRSGLRGMLLYSNQSFMQVLEGEDAALQTTYERILSDARHKNLRMLMNADVDAPMFPDWSMGYEHVDEQEPATGSDSFDNESTYPLTARLLKRAWSVNPDLSTTTGVGTTLASLYARNKAV